MKFEYPVIECVVLATETITAGGTDGSMDPNQGLD